MTTTTDRSTVPATNGGKLWVILTPIKADKRAGPVARTKLKKSTPCRRTEAKKWKPAT